MDSRILRLLAFCLVFAACQEEIQVDLNTKDPRVVIEGNISDNGDPASIPDRLQELIDLWRHQPPSIADFPMVDEIFPAASHQFVLYGMGFPAPPPALSRLMRKITSLLKP